MSRLNAKESRACQQLAAFLRCKVFAADVKTHAIPSDRMRAVHGPDAHYYQIGLYPVPLREEYSAGGARRWPFVFPPEMVREPCLLDVVARLLYWRDMVQLADSDTLRDHYEMHGMDIFSMRARAKWLQQMFTPGQMQAMEDIVDNVIDD